MTSQIAEQGFSQTLDEIVKNNVNESASEKTIKVNTNPDVVAYIEQGATKGFISSIGKLNTAGTLLTIYSGNITLLKDVTVEVANLYATTKINLNLNGHKLKHDANYGILVYGGTLTVDDTSADQTGSIEDIKSGAQGTICLYDGANFILNGGLVQGLDYGVYCFLGTSSKPNSIVVNNGKVSCEGYAVGVFDYCSFELNDGLIESKQGFAICNNGSDEADSTMIINGGTVKGAAEAIYHPGVGTLTIAGGYLEGGETGIELRAGSIVMTGGKVVGLATPTSSDSNGNGMTTVGAGIAIAQHTTKKAISVSISGGTVEGYTALYEMNPENNGASDLAKISVSVTGGIFNVINGGTNSVYLSDLAFTACSGYTANGKVIDTTGEH